MKKFLIKTITFILFLVIPFFLIEFSVRDNTFKLKAEYVEQNKDNIEVMILGSSQNWRALNPEFINAKIAPLAHGGSAINLDFLLFEKYSEVLPKLKVVVFELGCHNLEDFRDHNWGKNHLFHIYYDINNYGGSPSFKENFLLTANPKEYIKMFIGFISSQKTRQYNEYGFITESPNMLFESLGYDSLRIEEGVKEYLKTRHKAISEEKYVEHTTILKKIVDRCLKDNISVVFLSPPKHYTYNEGMPESKIVRRDKFAASYNSNDDVYFWNFEKEYEYESELFINPDHLNTTGAKILSRKVDSLLQEIIDVNQ